MDGGHFASQTTLVVHGGWHGLFPCKTLGETPRLDKMGFQPVLMQLNKMRRPSLVAQTEAFMAVPSGVIPADACKKVWRLEEIRSRVWWRVASAYEPAREDLEWRWKRRHVLGLDLHSQDCGARTRRRSRLRWKLHSYGDVDLSVWFLGSVHSTDL